MEVPDEFSTLERVRKGLDENLEAVDEFIQKACTQEILPEVTRYQSEIIKAIEIVDKTITTLHEMFMTIFLFMHSTENNTFRFLRFLKENNCFDFIHLDEKTEPSVDEMKLLASCNMKTKNNLSMDGIYSLYIKEMQNYVKTTGEQDEASDLAEGHRIIERLKSVFTDEDVVIEFILNSLCEYILDNNIVAAYEFIKFLHNHNLGIVPVSDVDIPSPTLAEINLFSYFSNRRSAFDDDYPTTVFNSIAKYEETIDPVNESMHNLVDYAIDLKEILSDNVETIK